jgi:deoxyuridine 5'-triphosphate nucleotidohydrolase
MKTVVIEGKYRKAYDNPAGIDIYATEIVDNIDLNIWTDLTSRQLPAHKHDLELLVYKVATGIKLKIPDNMFAVVKPRSSSIHRKMLVIEGVIDADYRGEIFVNFVNFDTEPPEDLFEKPIAQIVFFNKPEIRLIEGTVINDTERGNSGFGSSDENS